MSTVILNDNRPTKIISLPSLPDSQVEIFASLLVRDLKGFSKGEDETVTGLKAISKFIKSWNFTDADGKDLPINEDSVGMLKQEDATFLFGEITTFLDEQKKS